MIQSIKQCIRLSFKQLGGGGGGPAVAEPEPQKKTVGQDQVETTTKSLLKRRGLASTKVASKSPFGGGLNFGGKK